MKIKTLFSTTLLLPFLCSCYVDFSNNHKILFKPYRAHPIIASNWAFIFRDYSFDVRNNQILIFETFIESRNDDQHSLSQFDLTLSIKNNIFNTYSLKVDSETFYEINGFNVNDNKSYFEICYIPFKIEKIDINSSFSKSAELRINYINRKNYSILSFDNLSFKT